MDPFTLTDAAGTFVFDGTKGVFTSVDGATTVTFVNEANITATTPKITEVDVEESDGSEDKFAPEA